MKDTEACLEYLRNEKKITRNVSSPLVSGVVFTSSPLVSGVVFTSSPLVSSVVLNLLHSF